MNEEDYTEDNFLERIETTGVEMRTPDGKYVVSLMDTPMGLLYIFCDPPYDDVKYGVPTVFDEVRCLKFKLDGHEAVAEAIEWTSIAMFRHGKPPDPEDAKVATVSMSTGKKYRIVYQLEGQRRQREMVAQFIDYNENTLIFSGRPRFGTTSLNAKQIKATPEEVPDETECYTDRVIPKAGD